MSPLRRSLVAAAPAEGLAPAPPPTREFALFEELSFVRREAQAEADQAYADWCPCPTDLLAYAVYRAAQDRADAAQDDLAQLAQQLPEPAMDRR